MQVIDGLLDYRHPPGTTLLFTANSYIRSDGALVMGRGAAKQVRDFYSVLPYQIARGFKHMTEYNLRFVRVNDHLRIGAFQVKFHFKAEALPTLIENSARQLAEFASENPDELIHMNFPGIGFGRVAIETVTPLIACLPDNVLVYR